MSRLTYILFVSGSSKRRLDKAAVCFGYVSGSMSDQTRVSELIMYKCTLQLLHRTGGGGGGAYIYKRGGIMM